MLLQKQDASNYRSISTELTAELSNKDNELQELRKLNFDLKRRITELECEVDALTPGLNRSASKADISKQLYEEISNLKIEKTRMQQGAVSAIMEKDSVIQELEEELRILRQSVDSSTAAELLDTKEKFAELEEKFEKMTKQNEENNYYKNNEITELKERI